jgi:hypothetical protein
VNEQQPPGDAPESITAAAFIDAPRDADLRTLHDYWLRKRGDRLMPSRADIDPAEFRKLLPYVVLYNVEGLGGPYTFRLIGGAVVQFVGRNFTGKPAGSEMQPAAAAAMTRLLDLVVTSRAPKFRIGRAFWWQKQDYRAYEAAFMPLAADGETVNMIFAAMKFDVPLGDGPA